MELSKYEKAKENLNKIIETESNEILKSVIEDCEGNTVQQMRIYLMQLVEGNGIPKGIEYAVRRKMDKYVDELKVTIIDR